MTEWRVLTGLSSQPFTALYALASWPFQGADCPHNPATWQDTGLPASGSWAGLWLCRVRKQRAVFLLEGKVLESPHGQGCGQALPGESRGEDSREELGRAEEPAEKQASVGQGAPVSQAFRPAP